MVCETERAQLGARRLTSESEDLSDIAPNMPNTIGRKLNAKNIDIGRHWSKGVDVACARWEQGRCTAHAIRYCCKGDSAVKMLSSETITTSPATTTAFISTTSTVQHAEPVLFEIVTKVSVLTNIPFDNQMTNETSPEFLAAQTEVVKALNPAARYFQEGIEIGDTMFTKSHTTMTFSSNALGRNGNAWVNLRTVVSASVNPNIDFKNMEELAGKALRDEFAEGINRSIADGLSTITNTDIQIDTEYILDGFSTTGKTFSPAPSLPITFYILLLRSCNYNPNSSYNDNSCYITELVGQR